MLEQIIAWNPGMPGPISFLDVTSCNLTTREA